MACSSLFFFTLYTRTWAASSAYLPRKVTVAGGYFPQWQYRGRPAQCIGRLADWRGSQDARKNRLLEPLKFGCSLKEQRSSNRVVSSTGDGTLFWLRFPTPILKTNRARTEIGRAHV